MGLVQNGLVEHDIQSVTCSAEECQESWQRAAPGPPPCSAATARLRRPRSWGPPFTWRSRLPGELSGSEDKREPEPLLCWWSEAWEPVERSEDWLLALAAGVCAAGGGSAAACMQHACQRHAGALVLRPMVITRHAGGRLECQRVQMCVRQSSRIVQHSLNEKHAQDRRWDTIMISGWQPYRIGI